MKTHDYGPGKRGWGHDYLITQIMDGGKKIRATGWGRGIKPQDFLIFEHENGQTSRYQVSEIEYKSNPTDMWTGLFTFSPRS